VIAQTKTLRPGNESKSHGHDELTTNATKTLPELPRRCHIAQHEPSNAEIWPATAVTP
jgi:hypothetical protein